MEKWSRLNLRQRSMCGPFDNELIALRFVPKDNSRCERYEIGHFETVDGTSYFMGNYHSAEHISKANRKFDIWWTPLPRPVPANVLRLQH